MSLIGRGATGSVYQLNAFIAVKRALKGEDEQTNHVFQVLERHSPIPYLVRCYYQRPNDKFLEFAPNGCIATLLNQYQERGGTQVLKVLQFLSLQNIHRWMRQLCLAVGGLKKIGLAHGDIRPGNMLLDADWNLKLSDFDRAMNISSWERRIVPGRRILPNCAALL